VGRGEGKGREMKSTPLYSARCEGCGGVKWVGGCEVSTVADKDARRRRRRRWRRLASASRVKVGGGDGGGGGGGGGGDGLSSACKYFTLHSSQFSFRLGVSQSHNFASTPTQVGHSPLAAPSPCLFQRTLSPSVECTCFNHLVRFAFGAHSWGCFFARAFSGRQPSSGTEPFFSSFLRDLADRCKPPQRCAMIFSLAPLGTLFDLEAGHSRAAVRLMYKISISRSSGAASSTSGGAIFRI